MVRSYWKSLATLSLALATATGIVAQTGAKDGEWRFYGGDAGSTKYSPLDQINESNVKQLKIAWEWKAQNFGRRPDFNWEVTPLMVGGVLYFTAGSQRDAVAVDAATGETLWMYRFDEGPRGRLAVRTQNRGLAYWSDGKGDDRIVLISPGFHMIVLNARNGVPIPTFGKDGVLDLTEGLDRAVVKPGVIGSSSPAIVVRDTIVVGAALEQGTAPTSKSNVPGYVRGFDVHTGQLLWTFHTIPRPGEFGNDTWKNNSWEYTGNTGAWAPLSADPELGYVYIPVESPTSDFYGGNRLGNSLFAESIVCLDARTGKRIWYYQLVHHGLWDYDTASPPILIDITVDGKPIKAIAQVTKQAFVYVFDRITGKPVWPIEERPVPQSTAPGEQTSATQPIPTKPPPFDRQGVQDDDLIDLTPEIKEMARKIAAQYQMGPLYTPPVLVDQNGKRATLTLPSNTGGANWEGGCADPETGMLYVSSVTNAVPLAVAPADPKRSDMGYIARFIPPTRPSNQAPAPPNAQIATDTQRPGQQPVDGAQPPPGGAQASRDETAAGGEEGMPRQRGPRAGIGPYGLPLAKPPWGRITAIDLNKGEQVWMVANGEAPDYVKNNPALKGVDLSKAGNPERSPLMVTKTVLFGGDGPGLFSSAPGAGGFMFRAYNKKTGEVLFEMKLPAHQTGVPMTYMANGKQYVVLPVGATGIPAELVALTLP
jgi:quinoprotein glucose dehydrogenase